MQSVVTRQAPITAVEEYLSSKMLGCNHGMTHFGSKLGRTYVRTTHALHDATRPAGRFHIHIFIYNVYVYERTRRKASQYHKSIDLVIQHSALALHPLGLRSTGQTTHLSQAETRQGLVQSPSCVG